MDSNDTLVFCREIEEYIVSHNIKIGETSGLLFPLSRNLEGDVSKDWQALCYVCLWIALDNKVELPLNFYSRMVLGEKNRFSEMYLKVVEKRNGKETKICVQSSSCDQEMLAG